MKLLLGGGEVRKKGFTNVDVLALPTVDVVHDLNKPLPFKDDSVDEVLADYVMEHIENFVPLMEELYRVCQNGARIVIKVPYFKSTAAFKDPTHVLFFTERTFEYFDKRYTEDHRLPEYQLKCDFRMQKLTYNYYTRGTKYLPFVGLLRRFLWDIVKSIVVELRVVKNDPTKSI